VWIVSEDFLGALRGSHTVKSTVDVFFAGTLVMSGLAIQDGSVTVDESSAVRRTATITVSDPDLDPAGIIDMLAPFGTELLIQRGIVFPDGNEELVPLGVFRIEEASRSGWYEGVQLTCVDRSAALQDARFIKPWNTPAGKSIIQEITDLVMDAFPLVEIYDNTASEATTTAATWDRDRTEAIDTLAKSIGADCYFDGLGRFIIDYVPTLTGDAVWTVDAGPRGVMIDVSTGISRAQVYNAVAATGESADGTTPPVFGAATITSGDLAYGGPFGKKPRFYSSPFITTAAQAYSAASAILARSAGLARTVAPQSIVNPALETGDTLEIILPDGSTYNYLATSFQIPLQAADSMKITTRIPADLDSVTTGGQLS
jgi:hypothetical protein